MDYKDKIILQNMSVLYIEDEPITRKEISNYIKSLLGKLVTASNGLDGLKKIQTYNPDILIVDLILPDMTGIELIAQIRESGCSCPIITTTGLDNIEDILKLVDLGIEKYIIKPIDTSELSQALVQISGKLLGFQIKQYLKKTSILNIEQRKQLEQQIRNCFGIYLKELTGKGAERIEITLKISEVDIKLINCLTIMEKSLAVGGYDYKMIDFNRNFLYKAWKKDMEDKFSFFCDFPIYLKEIETNSEKGYDKLTFSYIIK